MGCIWEDMMGESRRLTAEMRELLVEACAATDWPCAWRDEVEAALADIDSLERELSSLRTLDRAIFSLDDAIERLERAGST